MRVLLTGASGFIGRALGQALAREGHEILALARRPSETDLPFPVDCRSWDAPGDLGDIDAVIHLAGEPIAAKSWTEKRKAEIISSRTQTTARLLEIVKGSSGRKPQVMVSSSAIGFYGDRGEEELTVRSPAGLGFLAETCVAWERAAEAFRGLVPRVVCLRTGIVLGRHGGALAEMLPLFKHGLGGRLGHGRQWMSWIHLEDMVALFLWALREPAVDGPVNAVAPTPVRNSEFTVTLARALGVRAIFPAPAPALRLVLGERSELLLDSQRVKESASALGFHFRYERLPEALDAITKQVERARGPRCHELVSEQWLPCPAEVAFDFFGDPDNLPRVSPPEREVELASEVKRLREGVDIFFSFRAWRWRFRCLFHVLDRTENQGYRGSLQRGPFPFWLLEQRFERVGGGTLVQERVFYRLPLGYLGDLLGARIVGRAFGRFFAFRRRAVAAELSGMAARSIA